MDDTGMAEKARARLDWRWLAGGAMAYVIGSWAWKKLTSRKPVTSERTCDDCG